MATKSHRPVTVIANYCEVIHCRQAGIMKAQREPDLLCVSLFLCGSLWAKFKNDTLQADPVAQISVDLFL
jgi:hypothetical protein